ncbi:MAG: VOC family protein [Myxococcota bacterium]
MNPNKLFPLVITEKLAETKSFYTERAGFSVSIEQEGYLQVRYGREDGPELAFMASDQAGPAHTEPFEGQGLIVSIPTASADQTHTQLRSRGATPMSEPTDKPWGWRSFGIADPNGVVLDFFHVIE